jgi:hypothetical protein
VDTSVIRLICAVIAVGLLVIIVARRRKPE